jgi:hypothetical protein
MHAIIYEHGVKLWLSARDTYLWAHKPGAAWSYSFLEGKSVFAEFDRHGLVDIIVNGGRGDQECPSDEFNAIAYDHLKDKLAEDHPAYFVVVGQFDRTA